MRTALTALLCLAAAGCDASGPDHGLPETVRGTVVSLSTGEPLAGLTVRLYDPVGMGPGRTYARTTTDARGGFTLPTRSARPGAELSVNSDFETLDRSVFTWSASGSATPIAPEMRVELWEIAELVVTAETDTPLGPGDRAQIVTPCYSSVFFPVEAGCARANATNEVTLIVTRDGVTTRQAEQVYTPLGERTAVRMTY